MLYSDELSAEWVKQPQGLFVVLHRVTHVVCYDTILNINTVLGVTLGKEVKLPS